jgi:hypothetical protein
MSKYRVECQVVVEVEAGSLEDVTEAVHEFLWATEVIAINSVTEVQK